MGQDRFTSPPNWTAIFTLRPDLDPPGYAETFIAMKEMKSKRKKKRAKGHNTRAVKKESRRVTRARFTSMKHGAD